MITKISYDIFDARYKTDPDRATCFECCDTLKEARENKDDYGDGNIIVKTTMTKFGPAKYEVIKSEIVT